MALSRGEADHVNAHSTIVSCQQRWDIFNQRIRQELPHKTNETTSNHLLHALLEVLAVLTRLDSTRQGVHLAGQFRCVSVPFHSRFVSFRIGSGLRTCAGRVCNTTQRQNGRPFINEQRSEECNRRHQPTY